LLLLIQLKQKKYFYTVSFISANKTSLPFSVTNQGLGKVDDVCPKLMDEVVIMCSLVRAFAHLREW
jgi:hypothetical protein